MGKIKLLIFDVGGTLIDFHYVIIRGNAKVLKKFWKIDAKEKEIRKIVDKLDLDLTNFCDDYLHFRQTDLSYQKILEYYSIPKHEARKFSNMMDKNIDWKKLKLYPDSMIALKKLQGKYFLATLSNIHDSIIHKKNLDKTKLKNNFHLHIDSHSFGIRKPSPHIFKIVLDHFQVKPHEAVMIGDTPSTDIFGAKRLGMHSILIDRRRLSYNFNKFTKPEHEIFSLKQLPKILQKFEK